MTEQQQLPVRLFVAGRPRTKGHMQVRGKGAQDRPLLQAWMRTLGRSIQQQMRIRMARQAGLVRRVDFEPYAGPVEVHAFFRFERETGVGGEVHDSHSTPWPTTIGIGDEDTLRRAVLDALVKSGVIRDDSLSVGGMNYKRWCEPGEDAGVLIVIEAARESWQVRMFEETAAGL